MAIKINNKITFAGLCFLFISFSQCKYLPNEDDWRVEEDVYGVWDLILYAGNNKNDTIYFRSTQFYFHQDGSCMVPTRLGLKLQGFGGNWQYCSKDSLDCLSLDVADPYFKGKWITFNKEYSKEPNRSYYLLSYEMCNDSLCVFLKRPIKRIS